MFIFLYSLCTFASPIYDAVLYQDIQLLTENIPPSNKKYWSAIANIHPVSDHIYVDTSTLALEIQEAQADALFLADAEPQKIQKKYEQSKEMAPSVQGKLLLALSNHGDCTILPLIDQELSRSHPLRLPVQTEAALYGLGILAQKHQCDFSREIDMLLPMLHSFSTSRRKAAAFALAQIQPKWEDPQAIWKASIREPHPLIRSWIVQAAKKSAPSEELTLRWFSDPDQRVRLQAILSQPESPLLSELLKDEELWVQLETIRALGKRGEDLSRIIDAGANIDAEEQSTISSSRRFAQTLVAINASENIDTGAFLKTKMPTRIRQLATSATKDDRLLKKLLKDKESAVRIAATKELIQQNPEDLDLLFSLLENPHFDVVSITLFYISQKQETALEEPIWSLLSQGDTTNLVAPILQALVSLQTTKTKEEVEKNLLPLFKNTDLNVLLPLYRLANSLKITREDFSWPEDIAEIQQFRIHTDYGWLQAELFIDDAPILCWQWITQIKEQTNHNLVVDGNFQYIHIDWRQKLYDIGEKNMRPIQRGSILYNPETAHIQIALDDHPADQGKFIVFGQIIEGKEKLRQLRPQDRLKTLEIIQTSHP